MYAVQEMSPDRLTDHLRRALDAAADGTLHPVIGRPSHSTGADAYAAIEARTVLGKTLLTA